MRFEFFYEDLLQEAKGRPMNPEKFEIISQNIGRWMFNFFSDKPLQFSRIPFFGEFKQYAKEKALPGENVDDIEQLVLIIQPDENSNLMYDWLNQIPSYLKSQEFIRKVGETFEPIGKRIKYYDRPDDYTPVRGRKPKEKQDIDKKEDIPLLSKDIKKNSSDIETSIEGPKRRGRKPSVETLNKLQTKYFKMYDDLEKQLKVLRELSTKINDYKKYFGKFY